MTRRLPVIGTTATLELIGHVSDVPAKIDTGADSSSVWASDIHIDEAGILSFKLFGKSSPFYTGETITRKAYKVALVRSSNGHEQIRYRTKLSVRVKGKRIGVLFNLSHRANNAYPVLIGRRTLAGKFLVDVSKREVAPPRERVYHGLNEEMQKNPHAFYKKYYKHSSDK